jgi:hypothetical protein
VESERQACEIRLRAERRWGQLYKAGEKAKNQHDLPVVGHDRQIKTLTDMGVSRDQSSHWQGLAELDDKTFEEAVTQAGASTTGILNSRKQHPVDLVDERALWLWGRLQDFRREGLLDQDPATICQTMMPHMRETVRAALPVVISWLEGIKL